MPYTNTHHPSNTRTTVTIVLSIIFGVSIIPTTAKETLTPLYFNLENAAVPTVHQEVRVKFRRSSIADIYVNAEDKFYFIEKTIECDANPTCEGGTATAEAKICKVGSASVTLWTVDKDTNQNTAEASVIIKSTEFTVGKAYKICYLKKNVGSANGETSKVREASHTLLDEQRTPVPFTILSSIYTTPVINPATVYAGQGPVTLSITVAPERANENKQVTQPAYLIPCTTAECPKHDFKEVDKDKMASLCSKDKNKNGAVATGKVTGFGTKALKTTFFAPLIPADSYIICVPYCFQADNCRDAVSWALVDSTTPITFKAANPSSYTIDLNSPNTLTFTGTDLKQGDKIRILAAGQVAKGLLCPSSSAGMPNTLYAAEVTTTSTPTSDDRITFSIDAEHAAASIGQVCYSLGGNPNLWAPVFQTPKQTPLYFSLENADVPTLYQEVRVKIRKGSAEAAEPKFSDGDKFAEGDKFYFSETEEGKCEVSSKAATTTLLTANEVGQNGEFAMLTIIIKEAEFTVGKTYKMCYIKKGADGALPKVYEASSTLTSEKDTPVSFTVFRSIYTAHETTPATVYAGQGPVTLTITNAPEEASGKAFGKKEITQLPYLIPCTNEDCSDKNDIAALCSKGSTGNQGSITTGEFKGYGTVKLIATFLAPAAASTKSYMICVPYCFQSR